jgi:hypothetical protein
MANRKPLTDDEGEVRELTEEDLKRFVSFSALPTEEQEKLRSLRKHRGRRKRLHYKGAHLHLPLA